VDVETVETMEKQQPEDRIKALEAKLEALEREVARLQPQVEKSHRNMATSLMTLIDILIPPLGGHCKRVSASARQLGAACGLSNPELDELELAGLLHDIGLVAVPLHKIHRIGAMRSLEERATRHPGIGYSLASRLEGLQKVAEAILHHHERYDGNGYPHKLWGDRIPLYSRILTVADVYDLELYMQSGGLAASTPEEARRYLSKERGRIVDPELTNKFLQILTTSEAVLDVVHAREIEVTPGALRPGMELSRDLRSVEKVLLLKAGTVLTDEIIDRMFSSDKSDWLVTQVYVDINSVRAEDLPVAIGADRREDKPRLLSTSPSTSVPPARRTEVLVVDDSVAVCSALRRELGLSGMMVTGATSYPAALETLKRQRFDVVITDLVISGSSGFEVLRLLRHQYPGLHAIVLSGFPTAENIKALREFDNVVRFVTKPWAQDILMGALREAVDRNRVRSST
jgi:response regulator RpfG family c-di-GMP phosphodiesterase